jgi:hypothetical protein
MRFANSNELIMSSPIDCYNQLISFGKLLELIDRYGSSAHKTGVFCAAKRCSFSVAIFSY